MKAPDCYNTSTPVTRNCIVCGKPVGSEALRGQDQNGRDVIFAYAPASRYWHDDGVFCSVEHSFIYHLERRH